MNRAAKFVPYSLPWCRSSQSKSCCEVCGEPIWEVESNQDGLVLPQAIQEDGSEFPQSRLSAAWVGYSNNCVAAIYGLMFQVSAPRFQTLNANLLLFAVQAGYFIGPVVGGPLVAHWDYRGYFLASSALAFLIAILTFGLPPKNWSKF